jgi:hypothetical protein
MRLPFRGSILCVLLAALPAMPQQSQPSPAQPDIVPGNFVDITTKSGVNFQGHESHPKKKSLLETMGSGFALLAYYKHGRLVIFFVYAE